MKDRFLSVSVRVGCSRVHPFLTPPILVIHVNQQGGLFESDSQKLAKAHRKCCFSNTALQVNYADHFAHMMPSLYSALCQAVVH